MSVSCVIVALLFHAATPAKAVASVSITVSALKAALPFYTGVLAFEKTAEVERMGPEEDRRQGIFGARVRIATLKLGDELIELREEMTPEGRPMPPMSQSNDRWFQHLAIVVSDMEKAYTTLRGANVKHVSVAPQTLPAWNKNAAGIKAFYFKDPDAHVLEVIAYPAGKGAAKWQQKDKLFLGIDHTAIVVDKTDASLAFYRDRLGLTVAGGSENFGEEQERLNHVLGARLRITTLRAPKGPGVELLEYLLPLDGRAYPADSRPSDLWHWQTNIVAAVPEPVIVRDPDGHAVELRK